MSPKRKRISRCNLDRASATSQVLGTARRNEHGAALARPGQGGCWLPVYGWFTEGFDTLDLKEAKALLEELAA
jgi:hypothetical protein